MIRHARLALILLLTAAALVAARPAVRARTQARASVRSLVVKGAVPRGIVSLTMAKNRAEVETILASWDAEKIEAAARGLAAADEYTFWSTGAGILLSIAVCLLLGRSKGRSLAFSVAAVAMFFSAHFTFVQNNYLRLVLGNAERLSQVRDADLVSMTRAAQESWLLLLMAGSILLVGLLAALRRAWIIGVLGIPESSREERVKVRTFKELAELELEGFGDAYRTMPRITVADGTPAGEPWIRDTPSDLLGLALSGGGIRSATFNLGLLQGFDRAGLLNRVHYLSTVSGGGYIGGFWTAYLSQRRVANPATGDTFPSIPLSDHPYATADIQETPEVRHLREFSKFLVPRVGFFDTETWHAIVVFLSGLVPMLLTTFSLIALTLIGWLAITFYMAVENAAAGAWVISIITAVACLLLESWWWLSATKESRNLSALQNALASLAAVAAIFWLQLILPGRLRDLSGHAWPIWNHGFFDASGTLAYEKWWDGVLMWSQPKGTPVFLRFYEFSAIWVLTTLLALPIRLLLLSFLKAKQRVQLVNSIDRTLMRLLGLALAWAAFATVWQLGVNFGRTGWRAAMAGIAAVLSSSAFALMRNWISGIFRNDSSSGTLDRLKGYIPQILAYLSLLFASVWLVSRLTQFFGDDWFGWYLCVAGMIGLLALMLVQDPLQFGLHVFYRERICRSYLGASNPRLNREGNRTADPHPDDDVLIVDTPTQPLHLVCCAANDLSGDPVATLSRGSKSATLSRYAVSIANRWDRAGERLSLGTALTASAAAFNSTMGSVSKRLGPAVTFVMTALNLRLGYWVRHPASKGRKIRMLPGLLLFKEYFGITEADGGDEPKTQDVHLSDGGHFDNLALYELVRRHCRYIIVSDCGADARVTFDDFGNAARRVREDFNVEIEIDLSVLRPHDGQSAQHLAVGTIHYDMQYDKGVLVYIKPALTGDEPPDVLQYRQENKAFPHESTADQFYDEAQWESYRRLGTHTAATAFGFLDRENQTPGTVTPLNKIFTGVRQEWYPTPAGLAQQVLGMTTRFGDFERDIRGAGAHGLMLELFPEFDLPIPARTEAEEAATLGLLLRAMQLMEDCWGACELDTLWNHPLNLGWINLFARWVNCQTFQAWWPILSPMYGPGFQRFMRERFAALEPERDRDAQAWLLVDHAATFPEGLAPYLWTEAYPGNYDPADRQIYSLQVRHPRRNLTRILIGLVAVRTQTAPEKIASWTNEDFFIPESLWGGGIEDRMLRLLLEKLERDGFSACEVTVLTRSSSAGAAQRAERTRRVDFYRQEDFYVASQGGMNNPSPAASAIIPTLPQAVSSWVQFKKTF